MRSLLIAICIFSFLAGPALALPFYVGSWVQDPVACTLPDPMLEFSEATFFGYEDTCELTNPVNIRGMEAVLFDAVCHGEGGEDTHRMLITAEDDTRIMLHHYGRTTILEACE